MIFIKVSLLLSAILFIGFQNGWAMDENIEKGLKSQSPPQKTKNFHLREYHRFVAGVQSDGSEIIGYGPKPREGGLGPWRTIEISPWVKSVKWIKKNMKENDQLEFIFDPDIHSVYVGVNLEKVQGHLHLVDMASATKPHGGNITKKGNIFRTDEGSGHFGANWDDRTRFKFLKLMYTKGFTVLHEPWVRDSVVIKKAPMLWKKKKEKHEPFTKEDYEELGKITERSIFNKFSDLELSIYQDNFLRKFGNSIFNLALPIHVYITPWSTPPSKRLYKQDDENSRSFALKDEFRDKGTLDIQFYNPEHGFIDPEKLEDLLYEYLKEKVISTQKELQNTLIFQGI